MNGVKYTQTSRTNDVVGYLMTKTIFNDKHYRNKNGEKFSLDKYKQFYYKEFALSNQQNNYDAIYPKYEGINKEDEPEYFATKFILVDKLE